MIRVPAIDNQAATSEVAPQRGALKQQAYSKLRLLVLSGELAEGTVQSVRQLATRLEMSKTPVHAAIERLESEGLVTLAPQQGLLIRELSLQDIVNHYEIRQALEPYVMRRLAGRLTTDQIELLRVNQARHQEISDQIQVAELIQIDNDFHQLLCSFLDNDEITQVMQRLRDKVQRVICRIAQKFPERIAESCGEHRAIIEALVSGDGQLAAELASEHLEHGLQLIWPSR